MTSNPNGAEFRFIGRLGVNKGETLPGSAEARAEYFARIHRVMDYIEAHLDQELTLEELARVACFSRFHFHRIFGAIASESLYQFILRLRLERAAGQLLHNPKKSVTEIALDCGFGSSASFARSFKAFFSMSASDWKKHNSKKCKSKSNRCKGINGGHDYSDATFKNSEDNSEDSLKANSQFWREKMPANKDMPMKESLAVRVENRSPMTVAYVRHVGPYVGNSALFESLFEKLFQWAGPRGFLGEPSTQMLSLSHDDPNITEERKLRLSVCVTVPPGTTVDGEVGIMEIPGGKYAQALFELDTSEFTAAWTWVFRKWMPESGFQPDDRPCFEIYLKDPKQHPEGKHQVKICVAVKPM